MRRCFVAENFSPTRLWGCRSLRTSPHSQPRAVKQLNNEELLKIVQDCKQDATPTSDPKPKSSDITVQTRDELPQTFSRLSARSPPLPRSPLTEPRLVAARARHRAEKPPASKERSPFQLKLERNPYAEALSTPPRLCLLTGVRLPSYFHIPFGVAKHPKTGAIWHLPRLPNLTEADKIPPSPTSSSPGFTTDSEPKMSIRTASGTHLVASRAALAYISKLTKPAYRRLLPYRWKEDSSLRTSEIVWREDMDTFVLEMLRKSVARDLRYLASRPAAYIAACKGYDNIADHTQLNAVIWLGPDPEASSQEASSDSTAKCEDQGPPPYAMHHYKDHYVPYYNLPALLGHTHLQTLKASKPAQFGGRMAVIKAKRTTVKVQVELWRLLGYLTHQKGEIIVTGEVSEQDT